MFCLEPVPLMFWLEPTAPAEVSAALLAYCNSTSSISAKASISWPSVMCGKVWVDGSGVALSPGRKRCCLILLGGIVRVVF
jgi:hypothetical protein